MSKKLVVFPHCELTPLAHRKVLRRRMIMVANGAKRTY
jgi:hypothetical protein